MTKKRRKVEDFVHLHTHSDMSQLDGCGKISGYVAEAHKRGNPAIAFTDHGTLRGYYNQLEKCQELGVKPIYGIEFYVSEDMFRKGLSDSEKAEIGEGLKRAEAKEAIRRYEEVHGIRDRWHLTVWAKNQAGVKNLFKLSTMAYLEGFYYKPRIDLKTLIQHGDGLAVATGCLSSLINDRVCQGKVKVATSKADLLREAFGSDLWLEVQPHAIAEQRDANKFILGLQNRYGGPENARLLATQDAHYIHQEDHKAHEVLLCIGTGSNLSDPGRFRFDGDEFHMRSRSQMIDAFKRHHEYMTGRQIREAVNNTMVFTEEVDDDILKIDHKAAILPPIDMPSQYMKDGSMGQFRYLRDLCTSGWDWREIPQRAAKYAANHGISLDEALDTYKARLKMELGALWRQRFVPYFLIVHDLYKWVRKQDIMCGPGRGSAAGSLVSFLTGITSVDPLEHGLIFERFISPNRIDMPDIDMDFADVRRQEIIQYLRDKYGEDRVAQIATVSKLSGKQCLKDVSRTLEVPYAEVNEVTNSIIERSSGDERASQTIEDSFKEFKVCRDFNKRYPAVLPMAKKLEGMVKNLGIHAAGVVTSPVPLVDLVPLETRKHEGKDIVVTAVDMHGVQAFGLVKLDVLGLRTLSVLDDAVKAINERHSIDLDLERLPLDDPKVLQAFTDHDYVGIFQYDSPGADKICAGVHFEHFEDIAAMTALNRPGTARSGLATQYVERKKNPALVKKTAFHQRVSDITSDTLGIIVYQEHVLKIFTEIAGFEPATADSLRKKIAKKYGDETVGKERENFIKGAVKRWGHEGLDKKTAGKIMDAITFFGSYGFNKSHATAYGIIGYWGMWLKVHYPLEFYWALLKHEPQRIRVQQIAKDAKRHEIQLLPPDVSTSKREFAIDDKSKSIRGSLVDIKGVGDAAANAIMAAQPYIDLWDFLERVDRRKVHKGVVLALAKAGALDRVLPNAKCFVEDIEEFWSIYNKKTKDGLLEVKRLLKFHNSQPDYATEERQLLAASVNPLAFGKHPIDAYADFMARHVKVPIADMSHEDFWKNNDGKGVFIAGVIVEVKYNQIGDFHTGDLPSEHERAMQFWGKRYANVNVEDPGGTQNRIKFDIDVFDDMRPIIDAGVGTPVVVHASVNDKFQNMRAHFAVDLEKYRKKLEERVKLDVWESILNGQHPVATYPWKKSSRKRRISNELFKNYASGSNGNKSKGEPPVSRWMTGVVTHVRLKYDKRSKLMAFFGMLGSDGYYVDTLCFASSWDAEVRKAVKAGAPLKIQLERQWDSRAKRWSLIFDRDCAFQKIPKKSTPSKRKRAKTKKKSAAGRTAK